MRVDLSRREVEQPTRAAHTKNGRKRTKKAAAATRWRQERKEAD
jgi:hypothetical protein